MYYPNPVNEELTIRLEKGNQQKVALKIYNMEGKLVNEATYLIENEAIHLTHLGDLAKGLYNVMYEWEGKPYHLKFLKD